MSTGDGMLPSSGSEFGRHIREMALQWRVLVAAAAVVGLGVFVVRTITPEIYESTAVVQLRLPEDVVDDGTTTEFRTESLAELATVPSVVRSAAQTAGVEGSVGEISNRINVGVRDTPGFLEVTATGPEAAEATKLAQAMAERLTVVGTTEESGVTTEVIVDASDADAPVSPHPFREGALAALVALLVAGEGVVVVRKLRGRLSPVDTAAELERTTGTPTLDTRRDLSSDGNPLPFFASYLADQDVITVFQFGGRATARPARIMASTAAKVKQRVTLIDLDLFDPVLHDLLDHPKNPGLAEVLSGEETLRDVVRRSTENDPVGVVTAGSFRSDLIGVERVIAAHRLITSSTIDHAVLSITSNSSLFDALVVASRFSEAVVLAVDPDEVKGSSVESVVAAIASVGGRLAAIMLYSEDEASSGADASHAFVRPRSPADRSLRELPGKGNAA
jgi:capsular polysaccharide biosynthesis protein